MVGVQGNGRGLRECGYPFCHVCGEDRVPLADHVRCGFLPYPAARSGSRTERAAALMLWERRDTGGYLAEIADIPDPADRLRRLIANAVRLSQRRNVYAALSQVDSEPAQAVLQRVAEQRIAFLTGLYADLGLPPQRARLLARLAYATYIGLMRITAEAPAAPLSTEDLEAFTDEATRALLPPAQ
ncbi:MAG TPA: hypothetical protein VGR98_02125 [Streptosporangiaceae bacterium]|nr:hypothetical protein [Streptosporangiaceae bacterium]